MTRLTRLIRILWRALGIWRHPWSRTWGHPRRHVPWSTAWYGARLTVDYELERKDD